jgi:hypothetical protein
VFKAIVILIFFFPFHLVFGDWVLIAPDLAVEDGQKWHLESFLV